jgi:Berberine and berberine like
MSQSVIVRHGGASGRVPDAATASSHRDAPYRWHSIACWSDPADTDSTIAWVRESSAAMQPFMTGGVYLNFEQDEGAEHVRAGYGPEKYARLAALKDKYDPNNLFRINQNIAPSRAGARWLASSRRRPASAQSSGRCGLRASSMRRRP